MQRLLERVGYLTHVKLCVSSSFLRAQVVPVNIIIYVMSNIRGYNVLSEEGGYMWMVKEMCKMRETILHRTIYKHWNIHGEHYYHLAFFDSCSACSHFCP